VALSEFAAQAIMGTSTVCELPVPDNIARLRVVTGFLQTIGLEPFVSTTFTGDRRDVLRDFVGSVQPGAVVEGRVGECAWEVVSRCEWIADMTP